VTADRTEKTTVFGIAGQSLRRAIAIGSREFPDVIDRVLLITDENCLTLTADPDLDLLCVEISPVDVDKHSPIPFSYEIIADCIGLTISFVWLLKGEDGRHDAIQFKFFSSERRTVQFMTTASAIDVYNVIPTK
jgi:hypothetical protein